MINKLIKQFIPACCLLFGVFASCASEDEPGKASQSIGISLELTTAGQTRSSVDPGTEAERKINSISVWFFNDGASDTEKAMFYTNIASSSSTGNITLNFTDEELRLHSMTSEGSYEVFVVANPPADATINGETTLADLKGYSYTAATRPGSPFCMTGSSAGGHNFGINSLISIPLLRVASRLDIAVKNATGKSWSIDKISIAGDQKSVLLFAPASGTTAPTSNAFGDVQTVMTTSTTKDEVVCSGYIYENRGANAVKVVVEGSVDGTAKTWTAELTPNGAATLPRNTICGVTLNLKEVAPVVPTDMELTLKGWNTKTLDTKFPATYLDLNKTKLEVGYVIGGSIGVKSDATTIHVDWSKAPGFYLLGHDSETEAVVALTDENTSLLFHFQGESEAVIPDGTITITAGNLSREISVSKLDNNIIFRLKSIEINGHTISDGDVIPADYWGSIKEEEEWKFIIASNIQWGVRILGYMPSINTNIIDVMSASSYNGISGGDSSLDSPLNIINIEVAKLADYLPAYVTMDFYLTTPELAGDPYKLKTIHFTIK